MRRNFQSFNLGIVGHARDVETRCGYILTKGTVAGPFAHAYPQAPLGSLIASGIAQDRDGDMRRNIGVQRDDQREVSHVLQRADRKSTRLNSSHSQISYAVFCLKKKR